MKLQGSCHCKAIKFEVETPWPVPYQRCYCSVCRKTQGGGGCAVNLGGLSESLKIKGKKYISVYQALIKNPEDQRARRSSGKRHFCSLCGSGLWLYDPHWPDLVHPFASAVDTPLPRPPESVHMMLEFKPHWVDPHISKGDKRHKRYPNESLQEWHERRGLDS